MAKILCISQNFGQYLKNELGRQGHEVFVMHSFSDGCQVLANNEDIAMAIWQSTHLDPQDGPQPITDLDWVGRAREASPTTIHVGYFSNSHSQQLIRQANCDHVFPLAELAEKACALLQ